MLKQYLEEKNISIYSLAKECGISYSALNDLANGKTDVNNMRLGAALELSEALGTDLQTFIRLCTYEQLITSPKNGIRCRITVKNKSYYADFIWHGEPVSLRLCKVSERNAEYVDIVAGWEADKFAAQKRMEEF